MSGWLKLVYKELMLSTREYLATTSLARLVPAKSRGAGRGLDLCVSPSLHPVSYFKFGQKFGDEVTELSNLKNSS